MPLVHSLAHRYAYRGEQLEDLVQIGAIGLIKAIDRFDVNRGFELTTYATPNIIGEIKRHFRDRGWAVRVPRGLQELNARLSKLVERADGAARPLADDRRARDGGGRRAGAGARGARVGPRLLVALALAGRPATRTARSSTRWRRSARSSRPTRRPTTGRCSRPGLSVLDDARALDPPPALLRGPEPVADRRAGRHLADARLAADPALAREDPRSRSPPSPTQGTSAARQR